jgi:two-component sensor histidine kinase
MRGTVQDITERKMAEKAMEKIEEARIKEIHHRIKNNLQVISSLLSLEAERFNDSKVLNAFKESQNRVASMALIHEELYRGKGTDNLDFAAYLQKLTADLFGSYNLRNDDISLKLNLEQVDLSIDTAIPLGIIVNELVSNSLKHAFVDGRKGEMSITLQRAEDFTINRVSSEAENGCKQNNFHYMLTVKDNGKGIPEEINFQAADSLGLQLVSILVEQIDGCIELRRDQGTEFMIWFSNNTEK